MAKTHQNTKSSDIKTIKRRPATTPEGREQQLVALAYDLAEERLRNGTATSQEVTHFLKQGTTLARLEIKKLEMENKLIDAKIKAYDSSEELKELYKGALSAMRSYQGTTDDE